MLKKVEVLEKKYKKIELLKITVEPLGYSVVWKGGNNYFLIKDGKEESFTFTSYTKKNIIKKLFN